MEFRIISRVVAIMVLLATFVGGFLEYLGLEIGLLTFPSASLGGLVYIYMVSKRFMMKRTPDFDPQIAAETTQQYANASLFLVGILATGGVWYHIANFGLDTEIWISKGKIWLIFLPIIEACLTAYISMIITGEIRQLSAFLEHEGGSSPVGSSGSIPMPDTKELVRSIEVVTEAMASVVRAMNSAAAETRKVKDGMAEVNGALTEIGGLKEVAIGLRAVMVEFSGFFGEGR